MSFNWCHVSQCVSWTSKAVMSFTWCLDTHMFSFHSNGLCPSHVIMHWVCSAYVSCAAFVLKMSCILCSAHAMSCMCLYCYIATVFMIAVAMMATWYDLMWWLGFMSMGEILFGKDDIVCIVEGARVFSLCMMSGFIEVWVRINWVHVRVSASEAGLVWFD